MACVPNFKWTMADTDRVVKMAKARWTAVEICAAFAERFHAVPEEIINICEERHVFVHRGRRVS